MLQHDNTHIYVLLIILIFLALIVTPFLTR
jgi:hypothetical protein